MSTSFPIIKKYDLRSNLCYSDWVNWLCSLSLSLLQQFFLDKSVCMQSAVLYTDKPLPDNEFSLKHLSLGVILYTKQEWISTCVEWLICHLRCLEETVTKFRTFLWSPVNVLWLPIIQFSHRCKSLNWNWYWFVNHQKSYTTSCSFLSFVTMIIDIYFIFPSLSFIIKFFSIW